MVGSPDAPELERVLVRVEADSLVYTRTGLQMRQPLALHAGRHNQVVLVRPPRVRSVAASHAGFPVEGSFPLPAVLSLVLFEHEGNLEGLFRGPAPREGVYQIFAHADPSGGDDHNKILTDRRAAAMTALLTGDATTMVSIAREESWGTDLQQVMLRALGCDPGPIDGKVGSLTTHAVTQFQEQYSSGRFHSRPSAGAPPSPLEASGTLDRATVDALVEAYTVFHSPHVPRSSLHPSHPHNGCAAFNRVVPDGYAANRRVSLVVYSELPPHPQSIPCTPGDAAACPALDDGAGPCLWFREHVHDAQPEEVRHHHFRLAWLELDNGSFLLSALTTVPDAEEVEIEVLSASEPVDGETLHDPTAVLGSVGASLVCKPVHGVAQVMWTPPPSFAPAIDGRIEDDQGRRVVPVFRIRHARTGAVGYDTWPADDVAILFDRRVENGPYHAQAATRLELVGTEQGYRSSRPATDATPFDDEHYILRFEGVPPEGSYSLLVHYTDGPGRVVLENVPYADLEGHPAGKEAGKEAPPAVNPRPPTDCPVFDDDDCASASTTDDDHRTESPWLF